MSDFDASDDSALAWASAWLAAVVLDDADDPSEDAAIWELTHESWRCAIAEACLGPESVELARTQDVTTLPDWETLARCAVRQMRAALPSPVQAMGIGSRIGMTTIEAPEALDRVQVVFNDQRLEPGHYFAPVGTPRWIRLDNGPR